MQSMWKQTACVVFLWFLFVKVFRPTRFPWVEWKERDIFLEIFLLYCLFSLTLFLGRHLKDYLTVKKEQLSGNTKGDKSAIEGRNPRDRDVAEVEQNLGQRYFQGDILTTRKQRNALYNSMYYQRTKAGDQPELRGLVRDIGRTWKNGVVFFSFHDNVDIDQEEIVREAMKHWEEKTCIVFKDRVDEADYILFKAKERCASYVGRKGGRQKLFVGFQFVRCRLGNIIHELGHAVGFFHEQSRPDRDNFITVQWQNIVKGRRHNFVKLLSSLIDSRNVTYDYNSIMHYGRRFFAKSFEKSTILPHRNGVRIGQRTGLSKYDIVQARKLYHCDSERKGRNFPSGLDNDVVNKRDLRKSVGTQLRNSLA